ncbi:MAG: FixH family protein [Bacteroidota bacterium]
MNWGTKIALAYLVFASGLFALVYKATQTEFHLVTENYYEKELQHNAQMIAKENSRNLKEPVKISYSPDLEAIQFSFPAEVEHLTGEVLFYHPVNSHKDQIFPISKLEGNQFHIDRNDLEAGRWKLQLSWTSEGKNFFDEKTLFLPNTPQGS